MQIAAIFRRCRVFCLAYYVSKNGCMACLLIFTCQHWRGVFLQAGKMRAEFAGGRFCLE